MKNFIINNMMNYIEKNKSFNNTELSQIKYGLVSIYLTFSKLIIISIIALVMGMFKEMIIFLLLFNIIRLTAFGLHATKSWICLISSSLVFIIIPIICKQICINFYIKILISILNIIFIYKNSPADTKKRPIVNKKRRRILKLISTFISICYGVISIISIDNFISNCLIFSIIVENCLIAPSVYKIFKLPYNNYITYMKSHPDFTE